MDSLFRRSFDELTLHSIVVHQQRTRIAVRALVCARISCMRNPCSSSIRRRGYCKPIQHEFHTIVVQLLVEINVRFQRLL